MKIVCIADYSIPTEHHIRGFGSVAKEHNCELETVMWLNDHAKIGEVLRVTEAGGSEAYEVPDFVCEAVKDADIIITQFCPINTKVLNYATKCRVVGVLRGGIENINLPLCTERGILVYNTPGRNADSVADYAVAGLLAEVRNVCRGYVTITNGGWRVQTADNIRIVPDMPGKTLGLVGYGNVGSRVAQRLGLGFGMNVLAYDPYFKGELPPYVKLASLEEVMSQSDFISVHARLTKETEHLVNAEMLALMKPTAYFVNTARSGIVDYDALYEALKNKKIMGAFIDVYDEEPVDPDYKLLKLNNCTVSPHQAGSSADARLNSPMKLAAEMVKLFDGVGSPFIRNPQILETVIPAFKA